MKIMPSGHLLILWTDLGLGRSTDSKQRLVASTVLGPLAPGCRGPGELLSNVPAEPPPPQSRSLGISTHTACSPERWHPHRAPVGGTCERPLSHGRAVLQATATQSLAVVAVAVFRKSSSSPRRRSERRVAQGPVPPQPVCTPDPITVELNVKVHVRGGDITTLSLKTS
ncbi:hypothetical protein TREES_T100021470 [Tupaia chinensis]|uniref:Uncharacterized protein n=1 Tax=Tupaia chinensis TaxID=246437 RepID=L9KI16_TUPCH|nr:hypothetical protein TREES_T100021470 [Tupaia chinensis]